MLTFGVVFWKTKSDVVLELLVLSVLLLDESIFELEDVGSELEEAFSELEDIGSELDDPFSELEDGYSITTGVPL